MTIPSAKAIAWCNGSRRGAQYMSKHTLYPYPVYVAEFSDGTAARMSFWQQIGKPWDFARGKRLALACRASWGDGNNDLHFIGGYVEHEGQRHTDLGKIPQPKRKRSPTAKELRTLIERMLACDEGAIREARELVA